MKFNKKFTHANPFRISFLSVAVICCIAISVVFYYINYINSKSIRDQYNQDKAELLMQDWKSQLQIMADISARIASNYEFHPYYFKDDVTKEKLLLENFSQYKFYMPLVDEYFLYYGGDYIYRSAGTTLNLDLFLRSKTEDAEECSWFRERLTFAKDSFSDMWGGIETLTLSNDICVLISFRVNGMEGHSNAVCGFLLQADALGKRFETIGGGINGRLSLYREEELLYSNSDEICTSAQKGVLTAASSDGLYTLCYLPERENIFQNGLFPFLLFLICIDIIFVFVITNVFAERAYRPIVNLSKKYKEKTSSEETCCDNALEEINYMMDSILQSNLEANLQIEKKQEMLRRQLLYMLLEGRYTLDMEAYLEKSEIRLPGPWLFVVSISFEEETGITEQFLTNLQKELEQLSDAEEAIFIYTVCNFSRKLINVICSVEAIEKKDELSETICDVAESFRYESIIGIGKEYKALTNLSASWLESMDDIHCRKKQVQKEKRGNFIYDSNELSKIVTALEMGNEEGALESLDCYILQLKQSPDSLLMQQYIFADFLGEITRLGKKIHLELSRQNISLLVSSKSIDDFYIAARTIIHDFCIGYSDMKKQLIEKELYTVYEYINTHFAEYDMSLEKTAADLQVSMGVVRKAVAEYTGKTYKDYLIYLRIGYAKQLLESEDLSIAEIGSRTGYGSVSYFIKLFRETTGMTPARYRKNCAAKP